MSNKLTQTPKLSNFLKSLLSFTLKYLINRSDQHQLHIWSVFEFKFYTFDFLYMHFRNRNNRFCNIHQYIGSLLLLLSSVTKQCILCIFNTLCLCHFHFFELPVNMEVHFRICSEFDFQRTQKCIYVFCLSTLFRLIFNVSHLDLTFSTLYCLSSLIIGNMVDN